MIEGLDVNTVIVSLFSTGGWLGFILKLYSDNRKEKKDIIIELKEENELLNSLVNQYKNIREKEIKIDKSFGSIYIEHLVGSQKREICGFCWEKHNLTIPVVSMIEYDYDHNMTYNSARCSNCENLCIESFINNYEEESDENVPF